MSLCRATGAPSTGEVPTAETAGVPLAFSPLCSPVPATLSQHQERRVLAPSGKARTLVWLLTKGKEADRLLSQWHVNDELNMHLKGDSPGPVSVIHAFTFFHYTSSSQSFGHQGPVLWKTVFPGIRGGGGWGWFGDDSVSLHLLHFLCCRPPLRSIGGRAQAVMRAMGSSCKYS